MRAYTRSVPCRLGKTLSLQRLGGRRAIRKQRVMAGERCTLRWGRRGRGEKRRTHATLHGARLLSKPRLLLFPPECTKADSQSGSSSIFATTAHKLVPKLLLTPAEKEARRETSAVREDILAPLFSVLPHKGRQSSSKYGGCGGGGRHEERGAPPCCTDICSLGSVEILIGLTHKQTQRFTHEFIQKAAQGIGSDLSFSKVTAPL